MKTIIVSTCLLLLAGQSFAQLVVEPTLQAAEITEAFKDGFSSVESLSSRLYGVKDHDPSITPTYFDKLQEAIKDYESFALEGAVLQQVGEAFERVAKNKDKAHEITDDLLGQEKIKEKMKEIHLMKPNAAKLISAELKKLGDERSAAILEKVRDEELGWWVEEIFSEKDAEHQRNRRSVIGVAMTARQASCFLYGIATEANVTIVKVVEVIREVTPEWMHKRSYEEILTKGLKGLSKLMRVVCHVSNIKEELGRYVIQRIQHESLDLLDRLVNETQEKKPFSEQNVVTYVHVNDKSWTRNPSYFMLRQMLTNDKVDMHDLTIFIRQHWPEKEANWMVETLMRCGKRGLLDVSFVANEIIKASNRNYDILNNEESLTPTTNVIVLVKSFCSLWRMAGKKGVTKDTVASFIQSKFPEKLQKMLLGQLALKGLVGVVDMAGAMCGVRKNILVRDEHSFTASPIASLPKEDKMMKEFTMWARDAISAGLQAAQPKLDNLKKTIVDAARQTQG